MVIIQTCLHTLELQTLAFLGIEVLSQIFVHVGAVLTAHFVHGAGQVHLSEACADPNEGHEERCRDAENPNRPFLHNEFVTSSALVAFNFESDRGTARHDVFAIWARERADMRLREENDNKRQRAQEHVEDESGYLAVGLGHSVSIARHVVDGNSEQRVKRNSVPLSSRV